VHGIVTVNPGKGAALQARIAFPRLDALPTIIARIRRVFDLMADPESIGLQLSEDPHLARLVAQRPGLRVPGAWDGFELAVRAVLGQQITVAGARSLAGKLVARYGAPFRGAPVAVAGLTHVFPSPDRLAVADLATLGMPGRRAQTLSSLAAAVVADPDIFGPRRSLEESIAQLRALPGVGEWTAQYIALRQMREPDAFPASDIGLLRAMTGTDGTRPSAQALLARAESWRPWRAYAAQHLWAAGAAGAAGAAVLTMLQQTRLNACQQRLLRRPVLRDQPAHPLGRTRHFIDSADALAAAPDVLPGLDCLAAAAVEVHLARIATGQVVRIQSRAHDRRA
jgi:AraC family transcriptional regulator of adaptative response / DNA-3-methyladenine glycosylase II